MKRPSVFPVAALFMLLAFSGCAGKSDGVWPQDKPLIMKSIQQMGSDNNVTKTEIADIERRLFEIEKSIKIQSAENRALNASIHALQAAIPRKESRPQESKKTERIAKKLQKIESSIRSVATKGSSLILPDEKNIEKNSYTTAYLALKSGRYEEASISFRLLLKDYPQGEYADQAYYWLGESYFTQNKMKEAIKAFTKVANDYPDSAKHPAALSRLASAYQQAEQPGDAKAVLQRLINQHPASNAAEQARVQLKNIEVGQKK